mgnify:CR=1 FL=1
MINNLRDLGGLTASGGRIIKAHKLIRCARLAHADENDIKMLHSLDVKYIYDLRLPSEAAKYPDPKIEGLTYISWPFQDENHLKGENSLKEFNEKLKTAKSDDERISLIPDMKDFYVMMFTDRPSMERLREVAVRILSNRDGACLFHCTSGKDRTGMLGALMLMYLGVSAEDIVSDYMQSMEFSKGEARGFYDNVKSRGGSEALAQAISGMYILKEANIRIFLAGLKASWSFFALPDDTLAEIRENILV